MDLPPVRFEMLRLNLNPSPAAPTCIPAPGPDAQVLSFSMVEAPPCRDPSARLAVDEPPGWTLPPPPVPPRPAS
ncbi:MAG: hypothetical protein QUV06_09410 [Cyanobium sp. CZS 48M]|nr:hypothetical protein [Cyanobium sp. CZS48M]